MASAVRTTILHMSIRNCKYSRLNLVHRCLGQRWHRRNFSLSIRTCEKQKDPQDERGKIQDTQNEPRYNKQNYDNPIRRTFSILTGDVKAFFGMNKSKNVSEESATSEPSGHHSLDTSANSTSRPRENDLWPAQCDVLIIGGGAMGSSIAYHIKERALQGLNVVVVDEDLSYKQASTVLSVGGIRQQFSIPENILLSQYGAEFLRHAPKWLAMEGHDPPDMQFKPHGYLSLASEDGAEQLHHNYELQKDFGAKMAFMSAEQLKARFPWLNTDGVEAGVLGLENEGWFDPWSFLLSLQRKAVSLGAEFVQGKVTGLQGEALDDMVVEGVARSTVKSLRHAEVTLANGEKRSIQFAILVVAAGAWTRHIGCLVGIGEGQGIMSIPIPIEPRKRYVYCFHAPEGPGLDAPLLIDPNGTYVRREGLRGLYLCGRSPSEDQEPPIQDLEVNDDFFNNEIWPTLVKRVPYFNNLKVHSSWAGYYDYNTMDQNAIVGLHPLIANMYIIAGFSGHGIQHAAGIGRAVMETILHGEYKTINLERFAFERILTNEPLYEGNIY